MEAPTYLDYYSNNDSYSDPESYKASLSDNIVGGCIIAANISVLIICGFGNILLLVQTLYQKKMQTSTNVLFINLALSDTVAAIIWCPLLIDYQINGTWRTGHFMCKISEFLKHISLYVSINSLVVIAIDRYVCKHIDHV